MKIPTKIDEGSIFVKFVHFVSYFGEYDLLINS